nr:MAG TPA: Replicative helicase [Caudoviricetes sp.]
MEINDAISGIAARAARQYARQEGDYTGEDGLLYCGKCHTPKQVRQPLLGEMKVLHCACKCSVERNKREAEEKRKRDRMQYLDGMRRTGFPDAEMRKWTFSNDDGGNSKIIEIAHKYLDNFNVMRSQGTGLLLYGNVGCGKSFAAACIANALIDRGTPCMMTNFSRIINQLQESFDGRQKYIDNLSRFDLLVIDDMAVERNSEYVWENIMNIVDSRYRSGLPLIVTTNLTIGELADPSDIRRQRVYSRLKEMCVPIEVTGADRRTSKMERNIMSAKSLLGL